MATNIFFSLVFAAMVVAGDFKAFRKAKPAAKTAYVVIMALALYCASGYVTGKALPNLNDAASLLFGKAGAAIDRALKAPVQEDPMAAGFMREGDYV